MISLSHAFVFTIVIGHKDIVRDVAEVNDDEILSCSNDATIRRWNIKMGNCLDTLYGHPNFIYRLVSSTFHSMKERDRENEGMMLRRIKDEYQAEKVENLYLIRKI